MTESGNWGGWSPERRPDEPRPADSPRDDERPADQDHDAGRYDGDGRYGAPRYGAPSYGGHPGGPPGQPTEQQRYPQPTEQPTEQQRYQQPTQQPTEQQRYQQPTQQQPTYGAPSAPPAYGAPGYGQPGPHQPVYDASQPTGTPYGGYAPPSTGAPDAQATQVYGYGATGDTGAYGGGYGAPTDQGGYAGYGAPAAPPAKKRSGGKIALIVGLVVVLVAGLGVGAWALFLRGGPAVTWQGKEVKDPEAVLTSAQSELDTLVSTDKGVKGGDTRCWYSVPQNPPKDTPKTDVTDTVYCGPALFVDGDTSKPYIPYGITASGSDPITLTVAAKGSASGATAVPSGQKLVRPDGVSAPNGAGGLDVPEPPPADANVFVAVKDIDVPAAPDGARMGGLTGGVVIDKLGEIKRYGSGTDARSAPDGQKLIAFQLGDAAGDGASDGASALGLQVSVDGGAAEDIPDLTGLNVIAVPTDAKSVDLVTKADGTNQTLSLLDGKPGAGNIAVLARSNRLGSFTPPAGFSFTETGGGASADRPCTLSGSVAGLFYWADDKGSATASAPTNAILETDLKYTFSTGSPAPFTGSNAGDTATFEPSHLSITLPDGTVIPAKLLADRTVFEVPAGFTDGTITVSGTFTNSNGITFAVTSAVTFTVSIPTS